MEQRKARPKPTMILDPAIAEWVLQLSGNWKKILKEDWFRQKYLEEELPIEEIGELAQINPRLVTERARELGFPVRSKQRRYTLRSINNDPWNKGLTKETHSTLHQTSERQKINSHFANSEWREKTLFTEEVCKKRAEGIKKAHRAKWGAMTIEEKQNELTRIWEHKSPNNAEQLVKSISPSNVDFVGNGQFWVVFKNKRSKNPDFIVRPYKEHHKVIEFFGTYWHPQPEEPELIRKAYLEVGVDCLIIHEVELKDLPKLQQVIKTFCETKFVGTI